jgi:hypothetical protein
MRRNYQFLSLKIRELQNLRRILERERNLLSLLDPLLNPVKRLESVAKEEILQKMRLNLQKVRKILFWIAVTMIKRNQERRRLHPNLQRLHNLHSLNLNLPLKEVKVKRKVSKTQMMNQSKSSTL